MNFAYSIHASQPAFLSLDIPACSQTACHDACRAGTQIAIFMEHGGQSACAVVYEPGQDSLQILCSSRNQLTLLCTSSALFEPTLLGKELAVL